MLRTVTNHLELDIRGTTNMVFSITAAQGTAVTSETLSFVLDGEPQSATELTDRHGTRLHQFVSGPGRMIVDYTADVAGREFLGFAHVDHHGLLAVDQIHGVIGRQRTRAGRARKGGPQQQTARRQRDGHQHPVIQ